MLSIYIDNEFHGTNADLYMQYAYGYNIILQTPY